jgi:hypothetical protein
VDVLNLPSRHNALALRDPFPDAPREIDLLVGETPPAEPMTPI